MEAIAKTRENFQEDSFCFLLWGWLIAIASLIFFFLQQWTDISYYFIAFLLKERTLRYGELKKRIVGISERMLILKLKELVNDGLVRRIAYPQVPPKVEYELTERGDSLKEIIYTMEEWGQCNLPRN